jgi:hypothetical protein
MKCPECDHEEPDNAAICSKCGLSFEVWKEMNPISASVLDQDMAFPEAPDDPAPEKPHEETPAPETSSENPAEKDSTKGSPKEKKPLPLALIGGIVGGLVLIGVLVFVLKKHSDSSIPAPAVVATELPSPSPVQTVPSMTPTSSPTATPASAPAAAKPAPEAKRAPAEPTHTSTPRPQATATFTPTDIPLDDKEPEKPSGAEAPKVPAAPATDAHGGDLLESAGAANTPTPAAPPVTTPAP